MEALAELSPDAITIGLLEPGSHDAFPDGWVHEKVAPATIIAVAERGHYEVHSRAGRTIANEGEAFLAQDREALKIIHHARHASRFMRASWLHVRFRLFHAIDMVSLFDLPPKLGAVETKPLAAIIRELRAPASGLLHFVAHARKVELGFRALRLLAASAPLNDAGTALLRHTDRLAPVLTFINRHLGEHLEVDDLARAARLSRSRLFAFFGEHLRLSPMEFVKQVRLAEVQHRLITTDTKLSAIAEATGFSNPFHLSREFKRSVGLPPVEFRRLHRKLEV